MPTIKDNLYFSYNGKSCRDFGLINVSLDNGMFEEQLHASRTINETAVRGNDTPLFHSVDEEPLSFDLTLAFENKYTDSSIDEVILWLFQDTYKDLVFEGKPDRLYQCMPVGDARLFHNGMKQGYVTIQMRCKSSKIVSPLTTSPMYDLSTNTVKYRVTLQNIGHVSIYPEISITKVGAGNLTFTNVDTGEIFEIRNLTAGEQLYINCEKEIIETDILGTYRYKDVVGEFHDMILNRGANRIDIEGKAKIQFRYVFKYKF